MTSFGNYPPNKAAGPDGIPSQLLKALSIQQVGDLANLFTLLANDLDYRPMSRPEEWSTTLAMLLPKEQGALTLDRHRAIALMSQVQKLFSKWLLAQMTPIIDPLISEHQAGFRRLRQASETLQVISKLIEMSLEWEQPLTIVRLDMKKAFDRVKQSSILHTLAASPLHPKLIFNAARELVGCSMFPTIYGCTPETPVPLAQGTKQGAPESGLYFVATLNLALEPAQTQWNTREEGCRLGTAQIHHLIFADDLLLIGTSPARVRKMFQEAQQCLTRAGLDINEAKTAYLTTNPASSHLLPGTNANDTGMRILGRIFRLTDNTPQDMDSKIGTAWSKFNRLRHILKADTPLPHRLRIFRSCVGQALLWASETWHLTRRRLQRIRGIELSMMKTLIKCPPLPPDTPIPERCAAHKAHIRSTLKAHKYEHLDRAWARRYYSWAGHLARLPTTRLAKQALLHKNLAWWRKQQRNPEGHRHTKRRGNISRWENPLGRHHPKHDLWMDTAQFRDRWKLYYPTFEKRLFGTNCPHDFSQTLEHNPDGNTAENSVKIPVRTPRRNPDRAVPTRRRPPSPQLDSSSREGKRRRTAGPQNAAPPKPPRTNTQETAKNWARDLDRPLIHLAMPQDVRAKSRARLLGVGVGTRGRATTTTQLWESYREDTGIPRKSAGSQEARERAESGAGAERRNSAGSGDGSRLGRMQGAHGQNQQHARLPDRRGQAESQAAPQPPSTSSSTSTSTSSSSTSSSSPGPRFRKGRRKGKGKGKSKSRQTAEYRAHAEPSGVLEAAAAKAAASSMQSTPTSSDRPGNSRRSRCANSWPTSSRAKPHWHGARAKQGQDDRQDGLHALEQQQRRQGQDDRQQGQDDINAELRPRLCGWQGQDEIHDDLRPSISGWQGQDDIDAELRPSCSGWQGQDDIHDDLRPSTSGWQGQDDIDAELRPSSSGWQGQDDLWEELRPPTSGWQGQDDNNADLRPPSSGWQRQDDRQANPLRDAAGVQRPSGRNVGHPAASSSDGNSSRQPARPLLRQKAIASRELRRNDALT